ncbi:MAG: fumarylacetoacetate hydrolase family protein [Enterobacterales bacterium]|nr:fumarylacetoacetate hydrolase family protein [Enterobacterales bacterium]
MFYPRLKQNSDQPSQAFEYPTSKVVCVGRNYLDHAKELNNPVPKSPLLFIKSVNTLVQMTNPQQIPLELVLPKGLGECHHEVEIAILVGNELSHASVKQCSSAIAGVGLAIDLTLRESAAKPETTRGSRGERAKCFDAACPVSEFSSLEQIDSKQSINFCLLINKKTVQQGDSRDMIFDIPYLMSNISEAFTLQAGDIILTGTPAGVGPLVKGDQIELCLQQQTQATALIV